MQKILYIFIIIIIYYIISFQFSLEFPNIFTYFVIATKSKISKKTICRNYTETKVEEIKTPLIEDIHCDTKYCDVSHSIPNPIIYNPYKKRQKSYQPSQYKSICMKCFSCWIVSEQVLKF